MDKSLHKLSETGEASQKSESELSTENQLFKITEYLLSLPSKSNANYRLLSVLTRQTISRLLYLNDLYQKIIEVPGVICEFGVHWGVSTSVLSNLRGIYEPYNYTRKIIGFDTFNGFETLDEKDGNIFNKGDYSSGEGHLTKLKKLLALHETLSPVSHITKYELVKGDVTETIDIWLEKNPSTLISMAILDMDVYKPTKKVLEKILSRLTKGSILVFDELGCPHFPGETLALMETIGVNNLKLVKHPLQSWCTYAIFQ